jgi:Inorganic pyrophosphatase
MVYILVFLIALVALVYVAFNYFKLRRMEEGTEEMSDLAGIIRSGARTFMRAEYKIILPVIIIVAAIFSCFIEKTSGLTFMIGGLMSSAACIIGMRSATYANVRTTNTARKAMSIGPTTQTALRGGSISGLSVPAFGLLGLIGILFVTGGVKLGETGGGFVVSFACNPSIMRLTTYSLGCSLVAMFNRIAGGNYTKAADISADIVAKIRHDMPEDDSRMPNTIADFIGDNINDIAGNCSDLLESFVATIVACLLISASIVTENTSPELFRATSLFPIIVAGGGLLGSLIGIGYALHHKASDNPSFELDMSTYISAGFVVLVGLFASRVLFGGIEVYDNFLLGWISPWIASVLGIASGVAIGKITEYYTGTDFNPVKKLAQMATEGEAFVVTKGDAIGSRSCLLPIGTICVALIVSGLLCGIYGIAVAALGMLSFVGTTVSIDAFGPIADNAGGIAESCHLPADVRKITDKLDAVGNTTAAIGKGFAIGSAAFATVSLIFAYVGSYSSGLPDLNIASYIVVAGAILGGAIIEYFSALLTDHTIESAHLMADEGDRQLSIPGVLEGTVKPDYDRCIDMAARQALRKMLAPSLLMLFIPAIGGILFGAEFVGGILVGATIVAIPRAVFMGNSGGAFDNAKKYVESGQLEGHGKGSAAHKATVVGDTVGDTRKDVVGVALDIAIKLMSTVANTLAPIFASFHLF